LRLTRSFETLQVGCGPHLAELDDQFIVYGTVLPDPSFK